MTGFVGSNFAASALIAGQEVVALTRGDAARARDAITSSILWEELGGADTDALSRLSCSSFAMEVPGLDCDEADLRDIFSAPCDYWHVAANTNLAPIAIGALTATNVDGTRHTLDAFGRHAPAGSRYMHVSTSYVCGIADAPVEETWLPEAPVSAFRTYYEFTKRQAEHLVQAALEEGAVEGAVLRLGQIVGSSRSGASTSDYGMYDFLTIVHRLVQRRPGEHVRIAGVPDATLHLVPIDHCVRWMQAVADHESPPDPPIYHVVDVEDVAATRVTDAVSHYLPVALEVVPAAEFEVRPRTLLERLFAARMTYLGEYVGQRLVFRRDNLSSAAPGERPVVDDEVLDRLVATYLASLGQGPEAAGDAGTLGSVGGVKA